MLKYLAMRDENKASEITFKTLTAKEQKIFNLLLEGDAFKEIGYKLKTNYNTVMWHQKNLYRKLSVNSINELLTKFSKTNAAVLSPLVDDSEFFTRWITSYDDFGSHISITPGREKIKNQYFHTFTISGMRFNNPKHGAYCTVAFDPHPSILEIIRKMSFLSFTYLGDGNSYDLCLVTSDSFVEGGMNHYRKVFMTKKTKYLHLQLILMNCINYLVLVNRYHLFRVISIIFNLKPAEPGNLI